MLVELRLAGSNASNMMIEVVALNNGATSSIKVGDQFLVAVSEIPIKIRGGHMTSLQSNIGNVIFRTPNSNRPLNQVVGAVIAAAKKIKDGTFHPLTTVDKTAAWVKDGELHTTPIKGRTCANCRNKRRIGGEGCAIFGTLPERIVDRSKCVHHVYLDPQNSIVEDFWPRSAAVFVQQGTSQIHLVEDEAFRYLRKGQTLYVTMGGVQLTLVY